LQSTYSGSTINKYIQLTETKGRFMSKGKDAQKTVKKKSDKTLKEKRTEKKEKKAQKDKF